MKRITVPLIFLLFLLFALGCSEDVVQKSRIDVPYVDPGVSTDGWATVPAGSFFKGPHLHVTEVDYDYQMMVTPVTNQQYADYLNKAMAAGSIKMEEGAVTGYYPGDKFDGYNHEF